MNDVSVINDLRNGEMHDSIAYDRFSFDLSGAQVPNISPSVTPNLNQIVRLESLKDTLLFTIEEGLMDHFFGKDLKDFLVSCHGFLTIGGNPSFPMGLGFKNQ